MSLTHDTRATRAEDWLERFCATQTTRIHDRLKRLTRQSEVGRRGRQARTLQDAAEIQQIGLCCGATGAKKLSLDDIESRE